MLPVTPNTTSTDWTWPDNLDAVIAAPKHHVLLMENEQVRVLETIIAPGEQTPVHTHRWPSVTYLRQWSPFVRTDQHGAVLVDTRTIPAMANPGAVLWTPALDPHALQNVGEVDLHIITVEIKS